MRVIDGIDHHPKHAEQLRLRRQRRRSWLRRRAQLGGRTVVAIEQLNHYPATIALQYRPQLVRGAYTEGRILHCGPYAIELDTYELELIALADGTQSLAAICNDVRANLNNEVPKDWIQRAIDLFAACGAHDMLETQF